MNLVKSVAVWPATRRHFVRLAWAVSASLLVHLALLGNLAFPRWSPAYPTSPLEVQITPAFHEMEVVTPAVHHIPRAQAAPLARQPDMALVQASSSSPAVTETIVSDDPPVIHEQEQAISPETQPAPIPAGPTGDRVLRRLPPNGKLIYRFYWGESRWLAGLAAHQWSIENGFYTLSSKVSTTGLFGLFYPLQLVETSKGTIVGDRLRPLQFSTQLNDYPQAVAIFNWDKSRFRWFRGDASFTQTLAANAYDKIAFLYQLYLALEIEEFLSADITMGRRLEHYDIRKLGVEEIEIDGISYPALHLKRATVSTEMEQVDIWLSASDNFPMKMTYSNRAGDHFEQLISPESIPAK